MPIREFEYMHGAVLAKILRKNEPLQLTLIETSSEEPNALYKIVSEKLNESMLYIKHSKTPTVRDDLSHFDFTFSTKNLADLQKYSQGNLILALVCAQKNYKTEGSEICVLQKNEITQLIDINAKNTQSIRVTIKPRVSLRVRGTLTNNNDLVIPKNAIETLVF